MKGALAWLRRRWLLIVALIAFAIFVILQFGNLQRLGRTLLTAQLQWIVLAVLLQVVYYSLYAVLYQVSFAAVEVSGQALELLPVLFASIFLKAVVPSGGVSAVAVFVDDAARRRQSAARAGEGALLVLVADLFTTIPYIIFGLSYLSAQGVLAFYQVLVSVLFVLFALAMAGVLLLGRLRPGRLRAVLEAAQRTINNLAARFKRPPILPPDWAQKNAQECIGAACNIAAHPVPLARSLLVAFLVHAVNVACLYVVSVAYNEPLAIGAAVAGFSMDVVFSVINIIPHGIGIVEGVMALIFISLGIPLDKALAITIAFRGLNLWLPIAIGFFLLPRVRSFGAGG